MPTPLPLLLLVGALVSAHAGAEAEITAVYATTYNGYARARLADGSYRPERFAFGEGGRSAAGGRDPSLDGMPFLKIARFIAPGLVRQNYLSSRDPENTDLLIMVYWGATGTDECTTNGYALRPAPNIPSRPPPKVMMIGNRRINVSNPMPQAGPQNSPDQSAFDAIAGAENRERDRANLRTAALLGYNEDLAGNSSQPAGRRYLDLVDELEDARYFVILRAYDFRLMWKRKQPKLLWEVRYSIRARGHLFNESLGAMTGQVDQFFGHDSGGLVRRQTPLGDVRMAEPDFEEFIGDAGKD